MVRSSGAGGLATMATRSEQATRARATGGFGGGPGAFLERERSLGPVLLIPGALLLLVFMAYPFLLGLWLSTTNSMVGVPGRFIGLENFKDLLSDSIFRQTARNTFIYA